MDQEFQFGIPEGVNQTTLHPLGFVAILVFGMAILFLPRRYAVLPMIFTACLVAPAQRIAPFTLNFTLLRIMVVFGVVRLLTRREFRNFVWKPLDSAILLFTVSEVGFYIVTWGTMDAVKNRLGWAYDVIGMYFMFRCLIRDWQDVHQIITGFVLVSIPVALAFIIENRTGRNLFAFFGGVPEITVVREGRLRCQGAFAHPILAGCFWASAMPLLIARLWQRGLRRWTGTIGLVTFSIVVATCASSTPVMGVLFGVLGMCMFPVRYHMKFVRWGILLLLCLLHLVMKKPVWFLLARIDIVSGSTGWHRYYLIDTAIKHFNEWWLTGTNDVSGWIDWAYLDCTNQYVAEAINGGLMTLVLFLITIVLAFRGVGRLWRSRDRQRGEAFMAWALGVSVFVHCMNYLAVSYFGQIIIEWYLILAIIGSLSIPGSNKAADTCYRLKTNL